MEKDDEDKVGGAQKVEGTKQLGAWALMTRIDAGSVRRRTTDDGPNIRALLQPTPLELHLCINVQTTEHPLAR